jgi:4-hydroxy-tetrahydrodipicolinate reductase
LIYKVGLCGATGRIGTEISGLLSGGYAIHRDLFELADAVADSKMTKSIDGVEVRLFNESPREPVHVWIDFSVPAACMKLLEEAQAPIVIGTTGFSAWEREKIEQYSRKFPVLLASNMSPGMNVLLELLDHLPSPESFPCRAVLEESHHKNKKDAPSGSALTMLEVLKSKDYADVDVHVTRAGSIRGYHSVRLISDDEEIVISHRVENRTVFARGSLLAAQFLLQDRTPRIYSMKDVLLPMGELK